MKTDDHRYNAEHAMMKFYKTAANKKYLDP